MRRLLTIAAVTALTPIVAWQASAVGPPGAATAPQVATPSGQGRPETAPDPAECESTTTTTAPGTDPCEPATTPPTTDPGAPTTTSPPTTAPDSPPPTSAPDTTPPSTESTTTTTTTTTTPPPTTDGPGTSTTTTTTTPTTTTPPTTTPPPTTEPAPPTTDPPKPPPTTTPKPTRPVEPPADDRETDPAEPPVEVPSGRVVIPAGKVDPGQTRSITFPVAGPVTYFNDFGACRDGCSRAHKGNDIIGDRLQPIVAMHDGVIDHLVDHPTAGYGVVIRDAEGWEYRVYHVNNDSPGTDDGADGGAWRYAPGIVPGASVTAGQFIGWMGDSGNSEGSVPHAHVEIHRPDGAAINPYWSLRLAQRDVNCAAKAAPRTRVEPAADPAAADDAATAAATTAAAATGAGSVTPAATSGPAGASRPRAVRRTAEFLSAGWQDVTLPGTWLPLSLTGGRPGSGEVEARMWVGPSGFTPVDASALQVGDARYDRVGECTPATMDPIAAPIPAELGAILATIRTLESGGDYTAESRSSSASGAYQFVDGTWGGYGGYARAKDAPPPVQDAAAIDLVNRILTANNGDVSTVPVAWYLGHVPVGEEWDAVPAAPGNVLTPREYQARWLQIYSKYVMSPTVWTSGALDWAPQAPVTCHTVVTDLGAPGDPEYVLTQARAFQATRDGRAVVRRNDPCDPNRPEPRQPPTGLVELTPAGQN